MTLKVNKACEMCIKSFFPFFRFKKVFASFRYPKEALAINDALAKMLNLIFKLKSITPNTFHFIHLIVLNVIQNPLQTNYILATKTFLKILLGPFKKQFISEDAALWVWMLGDNVFS